MEGGEIPSNSCNVCLGSTDPDYQTYNLTVSGVILAIVGIIGLMANILVMRVYLHKHQRIHSTSIYLAALAFSDFFLILTAMFLFVLEAWRHHDYPFLAWAYVAGAPIIFPIAAVFQTTSVYFCVAAAVDCFITVVLPQSVRLLYCTPRRAKITCCVIMITCILYNIPHFFELEKVDCVDDNGQPSAQICPTDIRMDPAYYAIYYTYMYTTFLAIGPLTLLILLNVCVVYTVVTKSGEGGGESDTVSLILVVFFFIFCNFTALLVNFMEIIFDNPQMLVYLVDLSNLLVVINGTANFFCYLCFGAAFRKTLKEVSVIRPNRAGRVLTDLAPSKPRMAARERVFAVLAVIFFLLAIALLAAFLYLYFTTRQDEVCMTPGCIRTASVILSSMNSSVDPCVDFYEYACGLWIKNHPIPDDAPSVSNFENLGQDLEFALKELLEDKTGRDEPLDTDSAIGKAKFFYRLCLNESEIFDNWRETFDEVVKSFGGWPSLGDPLRPDASIERLYADMVAKFRADSLFKATVQPDDKNSEKHVLLLDQPALNLFARDFYVLAENEERLAYMTLIRDVLVLLNAEPMRATRDAEEIIEFETALANITMADEQRHDIAELYTKMSLGEMRRMLPNYDWLMFFNHVFSDIKNKDGSRITFNESTEVVVYGVEFLKRLDQLLPKFDKRKVINYLEWCWFFKTMLRDLPDPFALTIFKFYKTLNLMNVQKVRWHGCVTRINSLMPMATSSIYVQHHFDHEAKQQVEEMITLIMEAFVDLLVTEDWLTKETKNFAKQKVHTMKQKIGYPDYLNDSSAVDKEYALFQVYKGGYYKTKFQFYEQYQRDVLERINEPVDRERWVAGAALVNAFYSPNTNEIIFPAGILQPVFYSKDFPSSMNFGGIGVVIGHEITHGFDDRGRLYDNLGNIRQWWDNVTIAKFEEKAECIEKQYSEYLLEQISMKINGRSTKGENIADNGGLKQAYKAYKKYERQHPLPPRLPGVNLTHDQLFFLNYAQIWCGTMNDKEAIRKLRTSEHSPGPIRVKGPLSNSRDFARAYNCPANSPMNPTQKCRVW